MKIKPLKLIISIIIVMITSCDEPETVVTDIIHPDGSVTRKIEMTNLKNNFKISKIQVPFDSTWSVKDSLKFTKKGDTIWVKRAEKFFKNTNEINSAYMTDSGANKAFSRRTEFKRKFKWFNTEYRFAEIIDKLTLYGYPVSEYLNKDELLWFYSPKNVNDKKKQGPDSLKYRALNDTVNRKTDKWILKDLVSEWIGDFTSLTRGKVGNDLTFESLKAREDEFVKIVNTEHFDSLWKAGVLLKEFIGEANALKYKTEADSAINLVTKKIMNNFSNYSQRIDMPGRVIGTNGFIDSTMILSWPVQSDYFLTEPYEMWAESKIPNRWAWILTGLFLLFVASGIIFRKIKKAEESSPAFSLKTKPD